MEKIPQKLRARQTLENSGLRLNTQIWLKARNSTDEIFKLIQGQISKWPNVAISTALIREKETGSSPLLKPRKPFDYFENRDFFENEMDRLKEMVLKYNNQTDWNENDYFRLFSSPLNINHLFVGISFFCDGSQFMKERWGKVRKDFPFMPVALEAQQGTWPRYFNTNKSEETRDTFVNIFLTDPNLCWKNFIPAIIEKNPLVAEAIQSAMNYICFKGTQLNIIELTRKTNSKLICFDAQYITKNNDGHEEGFRIFDFNSF